MARSGAVTKLEGTWIGGAMVMGNPLSKTDKVFYRNRICRRSWAFLGLCLFPCFPLQPAAGFLLPGLCQLIHRIAAPFGSRCKPWCHCIGVFLVLQVATCQELGQHVRPDWLLGHNKQRVERGVGDFHGPHVLIRTDGKIVVLAWQCRDTIHYRQRKCSWETSKIS